MVYDGAQDVVNNIALTVKKYEDRPGYSVSLHISREDEDKTGDYTTLHDCGRARGESGERG